MSRKIVQVVSPGVTYSIPINQPSNAQAVEVWNGTPFDLDCYGVGTQAALVLPAGTGHLFYTRDYNSGQIVIVPQNNNNVNGTGVVNIVIYDMGEIIPSGRIFPVTIPIQPVIVSPPITTINGNGGGTAKIYQTIEQSTIKITFILFTSFNNNNAAQDLLLPVAYTMFAQVSDVISGLAGRLQYVSSGVVQNLTMVTGVNASGWIGTVQTIQNTGSLAFVYTGFDTVRTFQETTAYSGFILIEGV